MSGNKVQDNPKKKAAPKKKCGAKTKTSGGKCGRPAGWGTPHPGSGRCKLHGGSSTGPKSVEGKQKIAANAIKHGAYSDKLLSDMERELYAALFDSTIEKHELEQDDPMQMATLQRACITYIKLIRLDEWELTEEIHPVGKTMEDPNTKDDILLGKAIYDLEGNVIGKKLVQLNRLKAGAFPNWEGHFQRYMQILGIDRGTKIKMAGDQAMASKVVDSMSWLWGGKSREEAGS